METLKKNKPGSLLAQVKSGRIKQNHFVVIHGIDGVGKTSFGAEAPAPIFIGPEKGFGTLDVPHFPEPEKFDDILEQIETLLNEDHQYKTLCLDSLDWLEPLVWNKVCEDAGVTQIEEAYGGFGKGYVAANRYWSDLIGRLNRLRKEMNIIGIAHSYIKPFTDPNENESYDRYIIKMNEKAASLWREAADTVLFANFDVRVLKKKGQSKAHATGDGRRVMFTERRPAFDAKNRFGLPFKMDLSWALFDTSVNDGFPEDVPIRKHFGKDADMVEKFLIKIGRIPEGKKLEDLSAPASDRIRAARDKVVADAKADLEQSASSEE